MSQRSNGGCGIGGPYHPTCDVADVLLEARVGAEVGVDGGNGGVGVAGEGLADSAVVS